MSIRASVFDNWLKTILNDEEDALILHIGCGMDSRVLRVQTMNHYWYDVDFSNVIEGRKKYFQETELYKMIEGDAREMDWLSKLPKASKAIVVLEGISMYLTNEELKNLLEALDNHFESIHLLMDCYSNFAAKMSKYKNPVKEVGVTQVYGIDDPKALESSNIKFIKQHNMIPKRYMEELKGFEKFLFSKLYAGSFAIKLYKLYEFKK